MSVDLVSTRRLAFCSTSIGIGANGFVKGWAMVNALREPLKCMITRAAIGPTPMCAVYIPLKLGSAEQAVNGIIEISLKKAVNGIHRLSMIFSLEVIVLDNFLPNLW